MGVVIGSLNTGAVPCVETHDSPEVTIGNPTVHKTTAGTGDGRWGNYADISMVRDIAIKRKFILKKTDIPAVTAWLASLNGQSTQYNTGTASPKTVAGVFKLDDEFTFVPFSPQLCTVEVTFTGQVLDCNFLLPSGLTFEKITDTKYAVKIGTTTIKTYESTTVGDGSGIEIRSGGVLMWDEVPYPAYKSLAPALVDLPTDPDDIAASIAVPASPTRYDMAAYRELYLSINGERVTTWYIPSTRPKRRKYFQASRIYYGVTQAEWEAAGNAMPTITQNIPMETGSERLSGIYISTSAEVSATVLVTREQKHVFTYNEVTRAWEYVPFDELSPPTTQMVFHLYRNIPTAPPLGYFHSNLCTQALQETGAWSPARAWQVKWDSEPITYVDGTETKTLYVDPNPHPYKHYALLGYAFVPHTTYGPWNTPTAIVAVYWKSVSSSRVQLIARGSDGIENVLIDWASS